MGEAAGRGTQEERANQAISEAEEREEIIQKLKCVCVHPEATTAEKVYAAKLLYGLMH